jgi:DNA-binding NtrC family response regulator
MPDLIVIDLDSHGPLGQALMEQISTDTHSCKVAIMGLTREGDLAMADAAYRYGARDLLVVPFDMLVLESKVQRLLERSSTGDLKNAEAMVGA